MVPMLLLAAGGAMAATALGLLKIRRCFVVIHVIGKSMLPTFEPGDRLLVRRRRASTLVDIGTVAVLRSPLLGERVPGRPRPAGMAPAARWVIKRIAALPGDPVPEQVKAAVGNVSTVPQGMLVLLADNPNGSDSRRWGFVPVADMLGTVISKLPETTQRLTGPERHND